MSLASATNRVDYTGNGAVDTYSYTFRIFSNTDLLVTVRDTANTETELVLTTDYTVTGVGDSGGGSVVLVNASQAWLDADGDLKSGYALTIRRVRPLTQSADIRNQGDFFPETHEDAFDHFIMVDQQQQDELDRSVKLPETVASSGFDTALPANIADNPGLAIVVNDDGDGFTLAAATGSITLPVSIANGGTNSAVALNNNRVMKSSGGAIVEAAAITANRVLISDANGIPTHNAALTASRALVSDSSGFPVAANPTTTEINYVAGATSIIQTQIDAIAAGTWSKNRMINGAMEVDQVNEGAAVTVNSTSTTYGVDGWCAQGQGADGVFTMQQLQTTPPSNLNDYLRIAVTTADASISAGQTYTLQHRIEGWRLRDLQWGTAAARAVSLSFWVRSSRTGTFSVALYQSAGALNYYVTTFVISAANTWERKTIQNIPGPTSGTFDNTNGIGVRVVFDLGSGSSSEGTAGAWAAGNIFRVAGSVKLIDTNSSTLDITGIQLEAGAVCSAFEYRPKAVELQLCQRYIEKSYPEGTAVGASESSNAYWSFGAQYGATSVRHRIPFRVRKRIAPTCSVYRADGTANSWACRSTSDVATNRTVAVNDASVNQFEVIQTAALEYVSIGHWFADARL